MLVQLPSLRAPTSTLALNRPAATLSSLLPTRRYPATTAYNPDHHPPLYNQINLTTTEFQKYNYMRPEPVRRPGFEPHQPARTALPVMHLLSSIDPWPTITTMGPLEPYEHGQNPSTAEPFRAAASAN